MIHFAQIRLKYTSNQKIIIQYICINNNGERRIEKINRQTINRLNIPSPNRKINSIRLDLRTVHPQERDRKTRFSPAQLSSTPHLSLSLSLTLYRAALYDRPRGRCGCGLAFAGVARLAWNTQPVANSADRSLINRSHYQATSAECAWPRLCVHQLCTRVCI